MTVESHIMKSAQRRFLASANAPSSIFSSFFGMEMRSNWVSGFMSADFSESTNV